MKFRMLTIGVMLLAAGSPAAFAHHSNAMFDRTRTLDIKGVVREFQWTNPHTFIELDVPGARGVSHFTIEGPTPGVLRARGWKFNSLKAGDTVTAKIHPLRDGTAGGGLVSVSVSGGALLEAGSSAVGVTPK